MKTELGRGTSPRSRRLDDQIKDLNENAKKVTTAARPPRMRRSDSGWRFRNQCDQRYKNKAEGLEKRVRRNGDEARQESEARGGGVTPGSLPVPWCRRAAIRPRASKAS